MDFIYYEDCKNCHFSVKTGWILSNTTKKVHTELYTQMTWRFCIYAESSNTMQSLQHHFYAKVEMTHKFFKDLLTFTWLNYESLNSIKATTISTRYTYFISILEFILTGKQGFPNKSIKKGGNNNTGQAGVTVLG